MQGSEDRIELTFGVEWNATRLLTWPALDRAKREAQQLGPQVLNFDGLAIVVEPRGRAKYTWVFSIGGVQFFLNRQETPDPNFGNVRVEIGSYALMRWGADSCYKMAIRVLRKLGGVHVFDRVQRVDPCVDHAGNLGGRLIDAYMEERVVTRAREDNFYRKSVNGKKRITGLMVGRGDITLRIYDKVRELEDKPKGAAEKRVWLVENRWGGEMPSRAWRIEFQVRSAPLRQLCVVTFQDWMLRRAEVCKYLCEEWFRICEDVPTSGNQRRTPESAEWAEVREGFAAWAGSFAHRVRRIASVVSGAFSPVERRVKAAVSSLMGSALIECQGKLEQRDAEEIIWGLVEQSLSRDNFADVWERTQNRLAKTHIIPQRCFPSANFEKIKDRVMDKYGEVFKEDFLPFDCPVGVTA